MSYKLTKNLTVQPHYNIGGISHIWLLNINDFEAYKFAEDKLYNGVLIEHIFASSDFLELDAVSGTNFTESKKDKVYTQKLTSLLHSLSYDMQSQLMNIQSQKFLIVFRSLQGKYHTFASDGGASISYSQQTGETKDNAGYTITIEKDSVYPLFELQHFSSSESNPVFVKHFTGNFCQMKQGKNTGFRVASYLVKQTQSGKAVDVNNNLCSVSKLKQAILLLDGFPNPDTTKYDVERTYSADTQYIDDEVIVKYDPTNCPLINRDNSISIVPYQIMFDQRISEANLVLLSSNQWQLTNPSDVLTCNIQKGKAGESNIKLTKSKSEGKGTLIFKNLITGQTVTLHFLVVDKIVDNQTWILEDGMWYTLGVWKDDGKWKSI